MAGDLIARDRALAHMALVNLIQKLAEGDILRRHPLAGALKQHDERNDEQDNDYPKREIPEIWTHLRWSRYRLQGVLISMLSNHFLAGSLGDKVRAAVGTKQAGRERLAQVD